MKFSPLECITLHYALELYKSSIEQVLEEEVLTDKSELMALNQVLEEVEDVLSKFGGRYRHARSTTKHEYHTKECKDETIGRGTVGVLETTGRKIGRLLQWNGDQGRTRL